MTFYFSHGPFLVARKGDQLLSGSSQLRSRWAARPLFSSPGTPLKAVFTGKPPILRKPLHLLQTLITVCQRSTQVCQRSTQVRNAQHFFFVAKLCTGPMGGFSWRRRGGGSYNGGFLQSSPNMGILKYPTHPIPMLFFSGAVPGPFWSWC